MTFSDNNETKGRIPEQASAVGRLIRFCLENKLIVFLFALAGILGGIIVAPFDWELKWLPRFPISVDAIPDIGENQQIVFTQWEGRSPKDVDDQVTYPLTTLLLGIQHVKAVRSYSMFGFSSIYIIFEDKVDFYQARTRVLEKLNSLPHGILPSGIQPRLGPDATALGQIFWYTLEGRNPDGKPIGGWDQEELRTIQDWYVRYWLLSAGGVAEVASVGGHVREYQVDINPDALRAYGITLEDVVNAVRNANLDVGAGSIEINRVEYYIRGVGFIKSMDDIRRSVVRVLEDNTSVRIEDIAHVSCGPAVRRGALDKAGASVVGGVVVGRYNSNPLAVIKNVKNKIQEIDKALPSKIVVDYSIISSEAVETYATVHGFDAYNGGKLNHNAWINHLNSIPRHRWPKWVTISKLQIIPFYDRTGLIYETLGTLNDAIVQEILVTVLVTIVMIRHLSSAFLISAMLPLAVLLCFLGMKCFKVDANIVALSGIAIAVGTIVDMGIVICDNIIRHLSLASKDESRMDVVHRAASEVGSAILTAVLTTVVSFLPVFTMIGSEGKLFKPLAYTKTFALLSSIVIALTILPSAAHLVLSGGISRKRLNIFAYGGLFTAVVIFGILRWWWLGIILVIFGVYFLIKRYLPERLVRYLRLTIDLLVGLAVGLLLAWNWSPLGIGRGLIANFVFVALIVGVPLLLYLFFRYFYKKILGWCLRHKLIFIMIVFCMTFLGYLSWLGVYRIFGWLPDSLLSTRPVQYFANKFPGLGREFLPPFDEGSFLWMPTTMPHASIGETLDVLQKQDIAFASIPEIESVVGKIGRVESSLDPAPISMIETIINYKPEYKTDKNGRRINFKYDKKKGIFIRDERGELIPDPRGRPFRQWREHIRSPNDIWNEIVKAGVIPGTTTAPKLQPIAARIVMLQTGIRAPMGIKVQGPDLKTIENIAIQIERFLKEVPSVEPASVFADRIVGKPYLEIYPDRSALSRYGISIRTFQDVVEYAIGGKSLTTTVEGRERFPVRVRYQRELRDSIEMMEKILVTGMSGQQVPLTELADIRYVQGPEMIKSEDTFLVGYVVFDKKPGYAEVDVVEQCQQYLQSKIENAELFLPVGVSYTFTGTYQQQVRAMKTMKIILPVAIFTIFLLIYLQFKKSYITLMVFSGIFITWAGGFLLLWLYGQPWFMNVAILGVELKSLFQIHPINLSVAIWVGFLALFGIATDDGVIMGTYLEQLFRDKKPADVESIRAVVIEAGSKRVRACLMTTATTVLALLPVLTSKGRGSDLIMPMVVPSFGGMMIEIVTMLIVPVLYCWIHEVKLYRKRRLYE